MEKCEQKVEEKDNLEENAQNNIEYNVENTIKKEKKQKLNIWIMITIIALLILLILTTGFAILNIRNTNIISGINIKGINIEGLNKEDAIIKLQEKLCERNTKLIYLKEGDFEYSLTGEQIELSYNIKEAVEEAYKMGRSSNVFINNYQIILCKLFKKDFSLEITYNEEMLDEIINDIKTKIPNAIVENNYYIEDEKLIITKGTSGNTIDEEITKKMIIDKLENINENPIALNIKYAEPTPIDIDAIHKEVYVEPKDAYYTKEPFKVVSHVNGVDFDLEAAREILKEDKNEYIIPLIIILPKKLIEDIGTEAFPDLLGSYTTKYNEGYVNRTTNLKLATSKINGVVVPAGEEFSYNKTLGKRTTAGGYKPAAGYAGGEMVDMIGGGICQISSTLYDAVVYANLEIVSRHNHAFLTSYISAGRDATVSYGSIDFKFKNTRKYPILIKASAKNGIAKVEIYGVREDIEYEIEIETKILGYLTYTTVYKEDDSLAPGEEKRTQGGMNGCRSIAYKIKKLNGVEVSREVLSSDTYNAMNRIIKRGPIVEQTIEEPVSEPVTNPIDNIPEPPTQNVIPSTPENVIVQEEPEPIVVENSTGKNTTD